MRKGKFIVFDGIDGSGKSTQIKLLISKLKHEKYNIKFLDFPRYGKPSAVMVEEYLSGKLGSVDEVDAYQASVLYAIDRFGASKDIKKWLNDGYIIVCDRYTSSNMGHQAGKIKDIKERDRFLEWVNDFEFNILKIPKPDVVVLFDLEPSVGQMLAHQASKTKIIKDIHEYNHKHLEDAAEAYIYCAKKYGWEVINCNDGFGYIKPVDVIAKEVYSLVKKKL
ncbi:MAG TPA: thymidylate kinase [archaeon]|nr:thymidylate kinase [archaeon]